MTFQAPDRLLLLLGVAALLGAYLVAQRQRTRYAVRFTNLSLLDRVAPQRPGWRRHVPAAAFLLMLVSLVVGFARPMADVRVPRERATVMVVVDTSTSMEATDVAPNRFEAAKNAANRFAQGLPPQFNVGLVSFDDGALLVVPPTTDRGAFRAGVDQLQLGPRTAIGEGIITALFALTQLDEQSATDPPPARLVLLSDGENTAGRSPEDAAGAAAGAAVPVSTIAFGTPEGQLGFGADAVPVPADAETLGQIAMATGGTFYRAESGEELRQVYDDIGSSVGYRTERREVSSWFIGLSLLAAFGAGMASLLWFSRLP